MFFDTFDDQLDLLSSKSLQQFVNEKFQKNQDVDKQYLVCGIHCGFEFYVTQVYGQLGIVISKLKQDPQLPKCASVEVGTSKSGDWLQLHLLCTNPNHYSLFYDFVVDLIAWVSEIKDPTQALQALKARYLSWRQFWQKTPQALSEAQIKGLIGELCYIQFCLAQGHEPVQLIQAWRGPQGGDQDFVFNNGWVEIKTIEQSGHLITISSIEQLTNGIQHCNDNAETFGHLVVVRLQSDPMQHHAFSLREKIDQVRTQLEDHPVALASFEGSLKLLGVDNQKGCWEPSKVYSLMGLSCFDALAPDFPKLTRSMLPMAMVKAEYTLSIAALEPWKILDECHDK